MIIPDLSPVRNASGYKEFPNDTRFCYFAQSISLNGLYCNELQIIALSSVDNFFEQKCQILGSWSSRMLSLPTKTRLLKVGPAGKEQWKQAPKLQGNGLLRNTAKAFASGVGLEYGGPVLPRADPAAWRLKPMPDDGRNLNPRTLDPCDPRCHKPH